MLVVPLQIFCAQVFSGTSHAAEILIGWCGNCGCWSGGVGGRGGYQWGRVGGVVGALDWGQGG